MADLFHVLPSLLAQLLIISGVAVAVKHIRLPYTIALVSAGLFMGLLNPFVHIPKGLQLTPDLLFFGLLPPLLFEGSLGLRWEHLRPQLRSICWMAIAGLLISTLLVGAGMHALLGLPFPVALLFGALISATDPISVLALFRELKAPRPLSILVEGESLLNDGVAAVLFMVILAWNQGQPLSPLTGTALFLFESLGGLAVGVAAGWLAYKATSKIDDHLIEITLSTILAYGTYLLADRLHVSGVTAVIAAGVFYGNRVLGRALSPNSQIMLTGFWEYGGFLGNSLVFLLIGTQVDLNELAAHAGEELAVFAIVVLARGLAVALLSPFLEADRRWLVALWWGGLRGSIAIALAMAITLPERNVILLHTFAVVILSLFVQGLTMKPLLRRLGITQVSPGVRDYELRLGELMAAEQGLAVLTARQKRYHFQEEVMREVAAPLEERINFLRAELEKEPGEIAEEQREDAQRLVRNAQLAGLREACGLGLISDETHAILREQIAEGHGEERPEDPEP